MYIAGTRLAKTRDSRAVADVVNGSVIMQHSVTRLQGISSDLEVVTVCTLKNHISPCSGVWHDSANQWRMVEFRGVKMEAVNCTEK